MSWIKGIFRREIEPPATASNREALDAQLRTAFDRMAEGRSAEAERLYRELLEDDPGNPDAFYYLAAIAMLAGRTLEAMDLCQKAIEGRPNDPGAWFSLAVAYHFQGSRQETVDAWRIVIALDPDNSGARNNFGGALVDNGSFDEGREELERLLAGGYETAEVRFNLAVIYRDHARIEDAVAACRRAIEMAPDYKLAYTNLLLTMNYGDQYDARALYEEHRRFGARFVKPYVEPAPDKAWPRRLRIGYVSPDFRYHVVMCFFEAVLERHDRARVEVFCYYANHVEDHVTERLRRVSEHWVDCAYMSDEEVADRVRADRIDILVDLAGHTGDNRLMVFTQKPAPVQATWLGYPGTTCISAIDYRITDARADPPGEADRLSAERLLRPWPTYFCFRVQDETPEPRPLPALTAGHVMFGCFNNLPKISGAFLDAAAQVLAAVPGSRFKLKSRTLELPHVAERVRARLRRAGVDLARVDLVGWQPTFGSHVAAYQSLDIALDSFPYNGATTTCEALWMGVPVITFRGDRHAGRMGASLLSAVGLGELVAEDVAGYVATAVALAKDLPRLEALRKGMRERMRRSPLMDEAGFTSALEQCYVDLWEKKITPQETAAIDDAAIAALLRTVAELRAAGRKIDAEDACKEVLKNRPDHMETLSVLWDLSYETKNHGVAVEWLRRGIEANDRIPMLHYMMGYSLMEHANMDAAADSFRKVLALDPSMAKAHNNLGCALEAMGNLGAAIESYSKAIELDPNLGDALYNLGNAYRQCGQVDKAMEHIESALRIQPRRADWKCNLGDMLALKLRLDEAAQSYEGALAIDPDDARAVAGRAWVLQQLGDADEADAGLRRAMELKPDDARVHSDWLMSLHYRRGAESLLEEHVAWAQRHARGFGRQAARAARERRPERRLNIGYVSPDFKRHSVACFVEPLLEAHDRKRFKIFCYSNVLFPDSVTQRIRGLSEEWRDTARVADDWFAHRVRADRIDILVDLAGHTGEGRMMLFARKLAPVQVTWLGYPNTTGLPAIDYRLSDAIADPPGSTERFHVEKLVRLAQGFLCYAPPSESPELSEPPALGSGHVTFGCFNNLAKITPSMIALWARLLDALPGSRLKLKSFGFSAQSARRRVIGQFSSHGVDTGRIELRGPEEDFVGHLAQYGEVDIALDVFPYNGTATTCEALWMGVPVVTLAGAAHVSRVGASILTAVGLSDLVADSADQYVAKALQLATDAGRLRALRATMRERLRGSPLLDAQGFARSVETAYCDMWDRWVENEEAAQAHWPQPPWVHKMA